MIYLIISVVALICITVIHVFIHNLLVSVGHKIFKTVAVYGVGLIGLLVLFSTNAVDNIFPMQTAAWLRIPLPLTAIVFYSLFSLLYIMFFTTPYTGDESPSIKLQQLIRRSSGITRQAIFRNFRNLELIDRRLDNLVQTRYIRKSGNKFYVSQKGQTLIRLIDSYRHLLRWNSSG